MARQRLHIFGRAPISNCRTGQRGKKKRKIQQRFLAILKPVRFVHSIARVPPRHVFMAYVIGN